MENDVFIGISVSQGELNVASVPEGKGQRVPNNTPGIQQLIEYVRSLHPSLIVIESNDGHAPLCGAVAVTGLPFFSVQSEQIKNFARALGQSDHIDASLIARFAQAAQPEPTELDPEASRTLSALVQRRSELTRMINDEAGRMESPLSWMRSEIEDHVDWLDERVRHVDEEVSRVIARSAGHASEPVEAVEEASAKKRKTSVKERLAAQSGAGEPKKLTKVQQRMAEAAAAAQGGGEPKKLTKVQQRMAEAAAAAQGGGEPKKLTKVQQRMAAAAAAAQGGGEPKKLTKIQQRMAEAAARAAAEEQE